MKYKVVFFAILLVNLFFLKGCSTDKQEKHVRRNEEPFDIRTDSTPVIRRLPKFPTTEELYWTARQLDERAIGPSSYELTAWAKLDKQTFSDFVQDIPTVQKTTFIPEFTPKQLENKYTWEELDSSYVAEHQIFGASFESSKLYVVELDSYVDREHFIMYIRVVTTT